MSDPRVKELARAIWIKAFPTTDMVEEAIAKAMSIGVEQGRAERLQELVDMEKSRDAWKKELDMYRDAWLRELGGKLFVKHHDIDALVFTTRALKEKADKWTAYENGILRRDPFWMVEAR